MTTLRDVATHAGVSISTVSRVVNSKEYVSERARQKVIEAIEILQYQPNLLAQSLATGKETKQLGLLVYDISNSYFAEITMAFEAVAYQHGYTVILCNTAEDTKTLKYLDMFIQRKTDGVAIVGSEMGKEEVGRLEVLLNRGVPIVVAREKGWVVNPLTDALGDRTGVVEFDTLEGARMAIDFLIKQGHNRIGGLFTIARSGLWQNRRALGYRRAFAEHGIPLDEGLLVTDLDTSKSAGLLGMGELLRRNDNCTAVFVYNDLMAMGALSYCQREGIRVPQDISIVSMDDTEDSLYTSPPLTTVRIPRKEQGEFMANYLLAKIQGGTPPSYLSLHVQLSLRQSASTIRDYNIFRRVSSETD
ncbi:MAG TPA: LacI family DNA-binding transcriptional regulator [Limnochordia bacterium]|nr:LacI family DNA-binding transcriptional regulator [Limnochordia bacterium]